MKRAILLVVTLLSLVALSVFPARGQDGAIVLKTKGIQNQFLNGLLFEVTAETKAPAKITEIKLEMAIKGNPRSSYTFLEFEPGTSVRGTYLLRTGGAQYKPPGILIEYRYVITDSEERTLETEKETFLYMDNRFQWEKVSAGQMEVYYYGPALERAQLILNIGTATVARMGALLGTTLSQPIRIIAYNNADDMSSALPFVSQAARTELLTQGIAFYDYDVLLVLAGDPQVDGVTSHEVTHMMFREATKGVLTELPEWLNEGMSEYANVNPNSSYDIFVAQAVEANKLFRLRQLQVKPGIPSETMLFYGQARAVVKFLVSTYGEDKIKELFAAFRKGQQIDAALKQVYGLDQDGLDNAWRKSIGLQPWGPVTATPPPSFTPEKAPNRTSRWTFGCAPAR